MKQVVVSISAMLLAVSILSGCGEKKEEPKMESSTTTTTTTTTSDQQGMSGMSGMTAEQQGMSGMAGMSGDQQGMSGMSGMAGMSGDQQGMSGMSGMSGMAGQTAGAAVDGEKVYKSLCFSCHDMGVAGAPKLGDKQDWGPRIAKGMDALYTSSLKGKNDVPGKIMPAKGGNPALSDDEVKAAVDYMASKGK